MVGAETLLRNAISLLQDLVSMQTVNPPGANYGEMSRFLKEKLEALGFSVDLIRIPEEYLDVNYPYAPQHRGYPRYIVLGKYGCGEPRIHFNGHYDVVPAGEGWYGDPFELRIDGEKLVGRGTSDMKGGIAALITALQHVVEEGKLRHAVEVAFVPDEESGGIGTKYLTEVIGVNPKYVLIAEPTSSKMLSIGHKGMVRGLITVIGKQAHASRPWLGVNAFEKACVIMSKALPKIWRVLRRVRSNYPFVEEGARYSTVSFGGYVRTPTMKDNVVPGKFTFSYDLRVIPELSNDDVLTEIYDVLRTCAREEGVGIEVRKLIDVPAAITPTNSPLVRFVRSVATESTGVEPQVFVNTGRYDLVFYRLTGSDVVVYGPGVRGQAHAVNEFITKSELKSFIKIFSSILARLGELR